MSGQVNLKKMAKDTAERYLKSVIVIDNEIFLTRGNGVHPLDGRMLTKAFAEKGIACAIYNPEEGDEDIVATAVNLISQNDAAIIDWQLGMRNEEGREDPSVKCREIIGEVLSKDKEAGESLRLLLIYTGEEQLDDLRDQLNSYLRQQDNLELKTLGNNEELTGLSGRNARIVFARKSEGRQIAGDFTPEDTVSTTALPDKLIDQFSRFANGILPMTTLNAIAALREHTHTLLGFFAKELDPAFVYHAATISDSRDCTAFLLEQIRDEVHTIIETDRATKKCTEIDTLRNWYSKHKCFLDRNGNQLKPKDAQKFILPEYREEKFCEAVPKKKLDKIYTVKKKLCRFSCIAVIRREAGGRHRTMLGAYTPMLTQGTLVQCLKSKRFLLCLIPRCDAVRLKDDGAVFPFLVLKRCKSSSSPHLCCSYDGDTRTFKLPKKLEWKDIKLIDLSVRDGLVKVNVDQGRYVFQRKDGGTFRWVADLKDHFITKLVADLVPNWARIGIDEYEWLRRNRNRD